MEVELSICHAQGTQSNKMTLFVFPSTLFLLLAKSFVGFFGCRCTLGWWSQAAVNSDFRPLSWAVMSSSIISIKELWFGLFSSTCITLFIYTETPMSTVCILFNFVRSCRVLSLAWHLTALRRWRISIDLVILWILPSPGCEWRYWIKPVSANTHCCLLSTIKALSFASQPLIYS